MIKNIISLVLLLVSAFISFRHGWSSLNFRKNANPAQSQMITDLGINESYVPYMGAITIAIGLLLLFPKTFFLGNLLSAMSILTLMALALHAGQNKFAMIEVPFLILPLLMIWLKYPFQN